VNLRTSDQLKFMRDAGLLLWHAHQVAAKLVTPGITTREIDAEIDNYIHTHHAIALFKGVPSCGGLVAYPAASCISVNEEVVHGIPSSRRLNAGDIVSIDIGVELNGWCADAAATYAVGSIDADTARLLEVTESALRQSISLLSTKSKWSLVVKKTAQRIHRAGFSIVEELVGHSIGQEMWEHPQVPNHYDQANPDFRLRPGLVLAIEPMVNMGTKDIRLLDDHWTYVTADGMPSAHFEHSVAITEHGPLVLTNGPSGEGWAM
jgi:methionyl aminopeptidase